MSNRKITDPQTLRRYRKKAAMRWLRANANGDVDASSRWFHAVDHYDRQERITKLMGHARALQGGRV